MIAVEYPHFGRGWMKLYSSGWQFPGIVLNLGQGVAQFCHRAVFEELGGYDESISMAEDVEFYRRPCGFSKRTECYVRCVEYPAVTTSTRRFDKVQLWRILLLTNPVFIRLAWRSLNTSALSIILLPFVLCRKTRII